MKKLILFLCLLPVLGFAESIGHENINTIGTLPTEEHLYWGFHIGDLKKTATVKNFGDFNCQKGTDGKVCDGISNLYKLTFSSGFNFNVQIGYQTGAWRYEAELGYFDSNHKKLKIDDVVQDNAKNKTLLYSFMLDAYYDFFDLNNYSFSPFIGIGAGATKIMTSLSSTVVYTKPAIRTAYNYILGGSLWASDDFIIDIKYKQLVTNKAKDAMFDRAYKAQAIEFGFRYNF